MALKGVALWVLGLALLAQLDGGAAGEETTTTHPDSTTTFVDELVPEGPTEAPKKSVKNFTCQVTGALLSMANSIKDLSDEVKWIKEQIFEKCPGLSGNQTLMEEASDLSKANTTEMEDHTHQEGTTTTPLPPIPTHCDEPFQPVASSCYYVLYYPHDWKTWGDANAFCQSLGGTLAAPYRKEELRTYLLENFSSVFWIGAKKSDEGFEWLNGRQMEASDWKKGLPSTSAAKHCVYLEFFSGYKAINHYCGEKFSFVCEKRTTTSEE